MPGKVPEFQPERFRAVAIGSSTGAPTLVQQIITGLPADLSVPVLIAQHLPPSFTQDMAVAMDNRSPMTVVEAEDGQPVFPGTVYLGRGRMHMRIVLGPTKRPTIQVSDQPKDLLYKPSVDELFSSCAKIYRDKTLGIVMTGIGRDGVLGAKMIVDAGGVLLTQSKATCAVYGMPRACDEAKLPTASLSPEELRQAIHQLSPTYQATEQNSRPSRSA